MTLWLLPRHYVYDPAPAWDSRQRHPSDFRIFEHCQNQLLVPVEVSFRLNKVQDAIAPGELQKRLHLFITQAAVHFTKVPPNA